MQLILSSACGMVQSCRAQRRLSPTCGMAQSCSSPTCRSYSCCAQVGWPRLTQACPVEATRAGGPELLKSNLSSYSCCAHARRAQRRLSPTCGIAQSCSSPPCRSYSCCTHVGCPWVTEAWPLEAIVLAVQNCLSLICRSYSCCAHVGWTSVTQAWPVEATRGREQAIKGKIEAPAKHSRVQTAKKIHPKSVRNQAKIDPKSTPKRSSKRPGSHRGSQRRPRAPKSAPRSVQSGAQRGTEGALGPHRGSQGAIR